MFGAIKAVKYQNVVEGTWGEFATPAGRVSFLMTKARLGRNRADSESRLTSMLSPVREVLDVSQMNFNQLLQRDLDDHRVAVSLLPYLIRPHTSGPAFFPPIMAAMLPFDASTPIDAYPACEQLSQQADPEFEGLLFDEWRYGASFRFQRMVDPSGAPHRVRFGRLSWNSEASRLVVLDGQHRAMALIAVDRTVNRSWGTGTGNRYRHFYEHRVQELMQDAKERGISVNLEEVEYPVTICWFPEYHGEGKNPHVVARKLFVDVNKNARAPSEARLILLSDTELINIFTRSLLNELRADESAIPLYAIEYDSPDSESSRPTRWSVVANLNMLKNAIFRTVFGPESYITDMGETFGGRPNWTKMNEFMRKQLEVDELFPTPFLDGERHFDPSSIANDYFPVYDARQRRKLVHRFINTWGEAIMTILGGLLPYGKHIAALEELHRTWLTDDAIGSLAREALFEGVGMYWTLRDSHDHWVERESLEPRSSRRSPDIVNAWKTIEKKAVDFSALRAFHYLGAQNEQAVQDSDAFYKMANTHACLIGVILTFATIFNDQPKLHHGDQAALLVKAWNEALKSGPTASRTRLLVLSRDIKHPLNQLAKMDTPLAVYFRYFWLELLCTPEAEAVIGSQLDLSAIKARCLEARGHYYRYLVKEKVKALVRAEPTWGEKKRTENAHKMVAEELGGALRYWFGMAKEEFLRWVNHLREGKTSSQDALTGAVAATDTRDALEELKGQLGVS